MGRASEAEALPPRLFRVTDSDADLPRAYRHHVVDQGSITVTKSSPNILGIGLFCFRATLRWRALGRIDCDAAGEGIKSSGSADFRDPLENSASAKLRSQAGCNSATGVSVNSVPSSRAIIANVEDAANLRRQRFLGSTETTRDLQRIRPRRSSPRARNSSSPEKANYSCRQSLLQ